MDVIRFIILGLGWAYLVVVLDWFSGKVAGWRLSCRCRTRKLPEALEDAILQELPQGSVGAGAETGI